MKNLLFLAIAFFTIYVVAAQDATSVANEKVYNTAEIDIKPEFSGGANEFYKFIAKNYNMPNVKKLSGKVYVTFVIEIDGSIGDIKVLRDIGYVTGEEAIRVLKICPNWKPGEQNGQKVRCGFAIPISLNAN